ncbi:SAICAR synthase-like protein [Ascodesmis nigricans]|uniref:SAICAR synthase-like protein n=1 Tax=Ascodesmis nigricans TaxID=341454 RepID=A0A4V3SIR0_9PEZI|nr:SAICAR synthase-like protein [Ascodesmis nigricans]
MHSRDDEHDHPDPVEQPQHYDWGELDTNKCLTARVFLPFFSTQYKTNVTMRCLLRCLSTSLPIDDDFTSTEITPLHLDSPLWKSPPIRKTWDATTFLSLYHAHFHRAAPLLFHHLRQHIYHLPESAYQSQFTQPLNPISNLGLSGSLFFLTQDKSIIIKSLNRSFEYTFLHTAMLDALGHYFLTHESATLIARITDVLYTFDHRFGAWLGISPSHYIVMENILTGLDESEEGRCRKWDLKPQNFFEPTRDLVPDDLKTEQAKSGLADALDEPIVLTKRDRDDLIAILERDLEFLEQMGTIDYSLLLGRYPVEMFKGEGGTLEWGGDAAAADTSGKGRWEERFVKGVRSGDGKWVYRMTVLDWLWNVERLRPKVMKTAGKLLPEQTVTTEPGRYRREFMKMMDEYIKVV